MKERHRWREKRGRKSTQTRGQRDGERDRDRKRGRKWTWVKKRLQMCSFQLGFFCHFFQFSLEMFLVNFLFAVAMKITRVHQRIEWQNKNYHPSYDLWGVYFPEKKENVNDGTSHPGQRGGNTQSHYVKK